jgi:hypothetical protein
MVFDTSEECRHTLDELLKQYTHLKDNGTNDYNHMMSRNFIVNTILRNLQNNISYVCFDTQLDFGAINSGQQDDLFTGIANAISGRSVTLQKKQHGIDDRYLVTQAKRYEYWWDFAPYKCKFFTRNRFNNYLKFFMEIENGDLVSGVDTDSETPANRGEIVSSMFTILQNMHDRVTRLESSLPRTRPSIACPRRLE